MTRARAEQVDLDTTPWYHCMSRCVRQAWLCGVDPVTGRDYSHRKSWIEQRIRQLASVFAIEIAAYAIMDNHYHIVLRVNRAQAQSWTDEEVLDRWGQLFSLPKFIQLILQDQKEGKPVIQARLDQMAEQIEVYRQRLYDISWYMRILNESIARMANKEDQVKGRFWQGRFKSQAILDEAALVAVMAYVDMNPLRAGLVDKIEDTQHTSITARLQQKDTAQPAKPLPNQLSPRAHTTEKPLPIAFEFLKDVKQAPLLPFSDQHPDSPIPISFGDYIDLIDHLARAIHPRKKGHTPEDLPDVYQRLGLNPDLSKAFTGWSERFGGQIGLAQFHRKGAKLNRLLFTQAA